MTTKWIPFAVAALTTLTVAGCNAILDNGGAQEIDDASAPDAPSVAHEAGSDAPPALDGSHDSSSSDATVADAADAEPNADAALDAEPNADAALDASAPDAHADAAADAHADAAPDAHADAAPDASPADSGVVSNDLADPSEWTSFDLTGIQAGIGPYLGATFDGRYLYLVPFNTNSIALRYDTTASLSASGSWEKFDLLTLGSTGYGFAGAVFDGRYVYLVPEADLDSNERMVRFDTKGPFSDKTSWDSFLVGSNPSPHSYYGGGFDGRYLYIACGPQSGSNGLQMRYDTTKDFKAGTSWEDFATNTLPVTTMGTFGAATDGAYVYYSPYGSGVVERFARGGDFTSSASWSTFDATKKDVNAHGFGGATSDGRYVYFVSGDTATTARYDSTLPFDATSSWSTFDLTAVDGSSSGFIGGVSDGRYVYYSPSGPASGAASGVVMRTDSRGTFADKSQWTKFDAATLAGAPRGFGGAAFDGTHVYFLPYRGSVLARFTARATASPSTASWGSFF